MYVGEYRDLLRDGQGSYTFPGGYFHYSGSWRRGKMHGQGEFVMADGTSYAGEFRDGEIEGIGLKRWSDGSSYNGHFHEGEMHGEGVYLSARGERYEGRWESNQRCGQGKLQYPTGDLYSGHFAANLPSGFGKLVYASTGHVYEGQWISGVRCGAGLLQDASGNRLYEGDWRNDRRHGSGIGVLAVANVDTGVEATNPLQYDGGWSNDKPEGSISGCQAVLFTPNCSFIHVLDATAVRTSKIVALHMTQGQGSRPTTANGHQNPLSEDEFRELPAILLVENKQLPTLAVVCMGQAEGQGATSSSAVRVSGEYGRLFRMRIFEGAIPTQTPGETVNIVAGSAWQFASTDLTASQETLQLASGSDELLTKQASKKTSDETELLTEARLDAVTAEASAGMAVFQHLRLPSTTLVGDYYLVCESMASDLLPPVLIPLSIK